MRRMPAERLATQRKLMDRRVHLADGEHWTKYAFPFIDRNWEVAFVVLDLMATGPRILRGPLEVRPDGLHGTAASDALAPVSSVPLEVFQGLVHFDPWWAFRGVVGVERAWVEAILATNLAGRFLHAGVAYKMHDLEFDPTLTKLEALVAKDDAFRTATFRAGEIDLLQLRNRPRM